MHESHRVNLRWREALTNALVLGFVAGTPSVIAAQDVNVAPSATPSARCIDTISTTPEQRIAYLRATVADSAGEHMTQSADLFAQAVAQSLRVMFGIKGDTLPAAEPVLSWRNIQPGVTVDVTVSRNGEMAIQPPAQNVDPVAGGLLTRVARSVQSGSDRFFWPPDEARDSATVELSIVLAPQHETSLTGDPGYAFPIFSIAYPTETDAVLTSTTLPQHPPNSFGVDADGTVILEFVVDSAGRVDTATVRDPLANTPAYPTGKAKEIYDDFSKSLRAWLPSATYKPATIGGCPVPQLVQQPFAFTVE